jgi:hypothetical protein
VHSLLLRVKVNGTLPRVEAKMNFQRFLEDAKAVGASMTVYVSERQIM